MAWCKPLSVNLLGFPFPSQSITVPGSALPDVPLELKLYLVLSLLVSRLLLGSLGAVGFRGAALPAAQSPLSFPELSPSRPCSRLTFFSPQGRSRRCLQLSAHPAVVVACPTC